MLLILVALSHILSIPRSTQRVTLGAQSRAAKYQKGPRVPAEKSVDFVPERLAPRALGVGEVVLGDEGSALLAADPGNLGITICVSTLSSLTDKVRWLSCFL